jgi:hypothetical protein
VREHGRERLSRARIRDVADLDWGNVPGWLGAGSLLLAFVIFNQDRQNAARSQVDRIGVWASSENMAAYDDRGFPKMRMAGAVSDKSVFDVTVRLFVRNASKVPARVEYIGYELTSEWMAWTLAEDGSREGQCVPGRSMRMDVARILVAPGETREVETLANLANSAPGDVYEVVHGVVDMPTIDLYRTEVVIRKAVIVDNAGRRWFVQPGRALRARRRPHRSWYDVPHPDFGYRPARVPGVIWRWSALLRRGRSKGTTSDSADHGLPNKDRA